MINTLNKYRAHINEKEKAYRAKLEDMSRQFTEEKPVIHKRMTI